MPRLQVLRFSLPRFRASDRRSVAIRWTATSFFVWSTFFGLGLSTRLADAANESTIFDPHFDACKASVTPEEEAKLRRDIKDFEAEITPLNRRLQAIKDPSSPDAEVIEQRLRPTQVSLLRALERMECIRLAALSDPLNRGSLAGGPRFVEMSVNYATDRVKVASMSKAAPNDPYHYYSGDSDPDFKDFSFGKALVTIPVKRTAGELKTPGSSFVEQPDPGKYFLLQSVTESTRAKIFDELNASGADGESSLLLFVHGFNVPFSDAALRTAQLAQDLQFPGKVMLYSWPSEGDAASYWKDEDSSRIAAPRFRQLLADLLATKVSRIFVIAHSMGTRIVLPALPELAAQGVDVSRVSNLVVAAADFNVVEFKGLAKDFAKLRTKGTHLTLYAASNDFALRLSRGLHAYKRLGESVPTLSVFDAIDSIDASAVAPMQRAYGHSYLADSVQVLGDLQDLLVRGLPPRDRGLLPIQGTHDAGWKIPALSK